MRHSAQVEPGRQEAYSPGTAMRSALLGGRDAHRACGALRAVRSRARLAGQEHDVDPDRRMSPTGAAPLPTPPWRPRDRPGSSGRELPRVAGRTSLPLSPAGAGAGCARGRLLTAGTPPGTRESSRHVSDAKAVAQRASPRRSRLCPVSSPRPPVRLTRVVSASALASQQFFWSSPSACPHPGLPSSSASTSRSRPRSARASSGSAPGISIASFGSMCATATGDARIGDCPFRCPSVSLPSKRPAVSPTSSGETSSVGSSTNTSGRHDRVSVPDGSVAPAQDHSC